MPISPITIQEQIESLKDDWDEDIEAVREDDGVYLAFTKFVKVPIGHSLAVIETYDDPTVRIDEHQTLHVAMSGRRKWQDDIGEIHRAVVAARELEKERRERERDLIRADFRRDYINAARDRVMVGPGMSGDRAWHRGE